jgi:hypothetical protein
MPLVAGMPSVTLEDVARLRLQTISFFLMAFLLSALFIMFLWNWLRRDFTSLPHLSYLKALGLTTLWGLLFVLVLTMISGARELMTPGAWEKDGSTYRLKKAPEEPPVQTGPTERERENKLIRLREALRQYARKNNGKFPADQNVSDVAREHWQTPDPSGVRYLYVAGRKLDEGAAPLAYEPDLFGARRLVLLSNGEIRDMTNADLERALDAGKP